MRVLIYGGRDFVPSDHAWRWLEDLVFDYELADWRNDEIVIVSGGARGADAFGEAAARVWACRLEVYPADWGTHGKVAGFIRNQQMLESGINLGVEFPGGNGTADMRSRLEKAGVKILRYGKSEVEDRT